MTLWQNDPLGVGQPFRSLEKPADTRQRSQPAAETWHVLPPWQWCFWKRLSHSRGFRLPYVSYVRSLILQVIGDIQQFPLQPHSSVPGMELVISCDHQCNLGLCKLSSASLDFAVTVIPFYTNKNSHCTLAHTRMLEWAIALKGGSQTFGT